MAKADTFQLVCQCGDLPKREFVGEGIPVGAGYAAEITALRDIKDADG